MKILIAAVLNGLFFTTFACAGELINKKTNEKLIFSSDYASMQLEINSTAESYASQTISLSSTKQMKSKIKVYGISRKFCEYQGEGCVLFLVLPPFLPTLAVIDTVILPIIVPMKLIQNASFLKDYELFVRSVANDESIEVSSARFKRIMEILKAATK